MRTRMGTVADWHACDGVAKFDVLDLGPRKLRIEVVTQGADVYVDEGGRGVLVASGRGYLRADVGVAGAAAVVVSPQEDCEDTAIRVLGGRLLPLAGWVDDASFTDLEPAPRGTVSPEVQAMFATMQRNMLMREARLLEAIRSREG